MNLDQLLSMLGLFVGAAGGVFGLWWGRKQAMKQRGLDERYAAISTKSLAAAWKITLVGIYVLFILAIVGVQLSVAATLGIILLVHMVGWAVSTAFYNIKL